MNKYPTIFQEYGSDSFMRSVSVKKSFLANRYKVTRLIKLRKKYPTIFQKCGLDTLKIANSNTGGA